MLVNRKNVERGVTTIYGLDHSHLGDFTLTDPLDAVFLQDNRGFAAFAVSSDGIVRKAHQPHYQSRDYNLLNGGIERWFEPVTEAVAAHPVTLGLLYAGRKVFDALTPASDRPQAWHVELHQFRIEAHAGQIGQPTPEGVHRDGVDSLDERGYFCHRRGSSIGGV